MRMLIQGGTVVYGGGLKQEDILIEHGKIREIRSCIRPRGNERRMDATSFFILPGFIATGGQGFSGLSAGVTTTVKQVSPGHDTAVSHMEKEQDAIVPDETDFVYQVTLPVLTKEMFDWLDQKRIKGIAVDWRHVNWELWLPRLERAGMVLHVKEEDFPRLKHLSLPMLIPFGKWRKTARKRTAFQIPAECLKSWDSYSTGLDPLVIGSYWLDAVEVPVPKLSGKRAVERFLLLTANVRSRVPARLYGIYPQKGSLHPGADADLLFVSRETLLTSADRPFRPERVMIKGEWAAEKERTSSIGSKGVFLQGSRTYAYRY